MTLPSGRVVSYTLSDNGRPTALSGSLAGLSKSYVTGVKYAPQGAVAAWNLNAGGVQEKRQYNGLFQLTDSVATRVSDNQRLLRLVLAYGAGDNNGNLLAQYTETGQQNFGQQYRYDALNRLRIAAEGFGLDPGLLQNGTCSQVAAPTWCVRYDYDRFGNAWSPERTGSVAAGLLATSRSWYARENVTGQPNNVTNKMPAANYDAAGNQTKLEVNNPNRTAYYDAEGRIKRIEDNLSALANYYYDAEGHRVRRVTGGASYWYVYGLDGQVAAEYQTGGILPSGTDFLLTDHLGSTRAKFNAQNQVTGRYDYEPFGGELVRTGVAGYGSVDPFTQRFTGEERDPETINSNNASGLDYFGARYFGASLGRFTSPDAPFADQDAQDPQSWNLYSYVRNNPFKFVDETGREIVYADRRLQIISDARRQQSTSYNSNLQGFEGPGSRTLTFQYGPTPNDPDGSPTNGLFSGKISPAIMDCSPDCVVKTPTTLTGGTITVNDKLTGDPIQTSDTLAHEGSHANDARTNPQRYSTEKNTDANGKIIPHDSRPVEQRAISGANQSNQERKDFKKRNPEQNQQIDRQRDQQLKQENERRKREGQN